MANTAFNPFTQTISVFPSNINNLSINRPPTGASNYRLNVGGSYNELNGIFINSYGPDSSVSFIGQKARGYGTELSGLLQDDLITTVQARGTYTGAGGTGILYTEASRASLRMYASENWNNAGQGTYMILRTTDKNKSTSDDKVLINDSGTLIKDNLHVTGAGNLFLRNIATFNDPYFSFHMFTGTTSAAQTEIFVNGISGQYIRCPQNTIIHGSLNIVSANSVNSPARYGFYKIEFLGSRGSNDLLIRSATLVASGTGPSSTQPLVIGNADSLRLSGNGLFITGDGGGDLHIYITPSNANLHNTKIVGFINQIKTN